MSNVESLRLLHRLIAGIHAHRDLTATVQAIAEVVVRGAEFGVAAVSVLRPDGRLQTVAVAGCDEARQELLGVQRPLSHYEAEFAVAQRWGTLRFVPHDQIPQGQSPGWVPRLDPTAGVDAWHPMDALFAPLLSAAGELIGVLSVDLPSSGRLPSAAQRDLLEVLAMEAGIAIDNALLAEHLRAEEEIFRQAFDGAAGGMAVIELTGAKAGRYLRVNPAFCAIVGYSAQELMRLTAADLTHPGDREHDEELIADLISGRSAVYRRDKRYVRKSGSPVWVSVTATVARADGGSPLCGVTQVENISFRRLQLQQLHDQARRDPLTHLPNRDVVLERLQDAVTAAATTHRAGAVLFVDVDDFKSVNDVHGHLVGDQVLAMVAQRLQSAVRTGDLVGRIGGDEFVVIAENVEMAAAQQLASRLMDAVGAPMTNKGAAVSVRASVGVALIPNAGGDPLQILQHADRDMYRRKKHSH